MSTKYIPFLPDTVSGQAILDNFLRTKRVQTLRYRDNDEPVRHILRGMPLYETELKERRGDNRDGNLIVRGECLATCAYLKDQGRTVDLVYIDPPFASGADYSKKVYIRRNPLVAEAIREAETHQLDADEARAFEEKMYGDIWSKERYLNWMYENLMAIKAVMSDNASIYVHLDWHIVHYVKILMDEIFGENNFINDITWKRQTSSGFKGKNVMGKNHDNILLYSHDSDDFIYNTEYIPYSEQYIKQRFCHEEISEENKKRYFKDAFLGTATTKETIEKLKQQNKIYYTSNGTMRLKVYFDETDGIPLDDVWTDINAVNSQADERVDYATQKPEALLERIIKASSNEGMTIADFFGGSGVTAAVANRLGRKFVHADVNINSIQTTRDRLVAADAQFDILNIKDGVALFRNPAQTMDKLEKLIPGYRKDNPFGGIWSGTMFDTKHGTMPVFLPNLLEGTSRTLDKLTMYQITRAIADLPSEIRAVVVYYIDMPDEDEIAETIREYGDPTVKIILRDLKEVLDDVVMEDEAEWTVSQTDDKLFKGWKVAITMFHSDRVKKEIEAFNMKGQVQAAKGKKFNFVKISDEGLETIEWVSLDCTEDSKESPWHSDAEVKIDKTGEAIIGGKKTSGLWDGTLSSEQRPLRMKIRNICGDETVFVLNIDNKQ